MEEKEKNGTSGIPKSQLAKVVEAKEKLADDYEPIEEKHSFILNFWYHHKWKVAVGAFFAFVVIFATVQAVSNKDADINIMYAGPAYINNESYDGICKTLRYMMSDDFNGDGEKVVAFDSITVLSDEQIAGLKSAYAEIGEPYSFNAKSNNEARKKFQDRIFSGEYVILLLDPALYENVLENGGLAPLHDFGITDEGCFADEYSLKLSEMKIYRYFDSLQSLPADTLLCIRKVSAMSFFKNYKKKDEIYANHIDFFKSLASFDYPEGYEP